MVKLAHVFNRMQQKRVLVAGDFMVDHYTFGKSKRISPEAPVPVILVDREEDRAGGAGNVVLNLISLGMEVTALGMVGDDDAGRVLIDCLAKESVETKALYCQKGFHTPKKSRIIASNQQIVRIDYERVEALEEKLECKIISEIEALVSTQDVVAISDYAKGFLTEKILHEIIRAAKKHNVPVIADPKGTEFAKYAHATILKPNLSEALAAANLPGKPLSEVAREIFKKVDVDVLMITRSEAGISLYYPDGTSEDHPVVQAKEIRDVTGAGDTVLAVLASAIANGLSLSDATSLSNIAATVAVERVGCARVTLPEIARRLIDLHSGGKIFENAHFSVLEQALKGKEFIELQLESGCEVNAQLLRAVRELAHNKTRELVVSIADPSADEEVVSVLASLKDVDYIHLGQSSTGDSCSPTFKQALKANQVFEFKGSTLKECLNRS